MSSEREFERLNLLQRDQLGQTTEHFLNLSSANRDKAIDPSSNDVTYIIPIGIKDSLSIEVEQFEIPHTRYAINSSNNTMYICLLYTSPSPRDGLLSRMPSSA